MWRTLLIVLTLAGCGTEPGQSESNAERAASLLLLGGVSFGDGYTSAHEHRITCMNIGGVFTCD